MKWWDIPGVLAIVVVFGALGLLCLAATLFGWW